MTLTSSIALSSTSWTKHVSRRPVQLFSAWNKRLDISMNHFNTSKFCISLERTFLCPSHCTDLQLHIEIPHLFQQTDQQNPFPLHCPWKMLSEMATTLLWSDSKHRPQRSSGGWWNQQNVCWSIWLWTLTATHITTMEKQPPLRHQENNHKEAYKQQRGIINWEFGTLHLIPFPS